MPLFPFKRTYTMRYIQAMETYYIERLNRAENGGRRGRSMEVHQIHIGFYGGGGGEGASRGMNLSSIEKPRNPSYILKTTKRRWQRWISLLTALSFTRSQPHNSLFWRARLDIIQGQIGQQSVLTSHHVIFLSHITSNISFFAPPFEVKSNQVESRQQAVMVARGPTRHDQSSVDDLCRIFF